MRLTFNEQEATVTTVADLRLWWDALRQQQSTELWLDATEEGPSLVMLVNGQYALLMYLPDRDGNAGFTSRNPHYAGPPDAQTECLLSNGQLDMYPTAWTLPLSEAIEACEYFITTHGDRSPAIAWHDDALHDEA
ncbi:MAG TPA: Imm1 family immunity protein [Ktedonobacterales bacterium]